MPSLVDAVSDDPAKLLYIGKSGAGKTGSLAALVCMGQKLRILDTDKGIKLLRSLLTDPHYPYATIIKRKGIDLREAVHYVPIDAGMMFKDVAARDPSGKTTWKKLMAPKSAKAWEKAMSTLDKWKEGEVDYGSVKNWTNDTTLVIDSFSTLSKMAYYYIQELNGRLGAHEGGFDYQRDIGGAQAQLTRFLEMVSEDSIRCNVVVISHITWVDESKGVAGRPQAINGETGKVESGGIPEGYPSAIGRALSPMMGKFFNDQFIVKQTGSGMSTKREIHTVPNDGVGAKNSVYLERTYPISYGLVEIFSRLTGQEVPRDVVETIKSFKTA